ETGPVHGAARLPHDQLEGDANAEDEHGGEHVIARRPRRTPYEGDQQEERCRGPGRDSPGAPAAPADVFRVAFHGLASAARGVYGGVGRVWGGSPARRNLRTGRMSGVSTV